MYRSEANDLALSVCRTVTGGEEVLVLNGAYHGHTIPLLGLSTYKAKQQTNAAVQWDPSAWPVRLGVAMLHCAMLRCLDSAVCLTPTVGSIEVKVQDCSMRKR